MTYPPEPPQGYRPPQGDYGPQYGQSSSPYGAPQQGAPPYWGPPPPRRGRGGLIVLIVFTVLTATGAGLYFTGVLDPLLKKAGLIDGAAYRADGSYTTSGLRDAKAIIGGKRWARPGECQSDWTEFRTDGTAHSAGGSQGTWDLLEGQDLMLRDSTSGRTTFLKAGADYALNTERGDFRLQPRGGRSVAMEYCGPAE